MTARFRPRQFGVDFTVSSQRAIVLPSQLTFAGTQYLGGRECPIPLLGAKLRKHFHYQEIREEDFCYNTYLPEGVCYFHLHVDLPHV